MDRLPYLSSCLGDAALARYHNWHLAIQAGTEPPISSWEEFEHRIRVSFEPPGQQQILKNKLRALRQSGSAKSYTFSFRALMDQISDMGEEDRISYYVHGLNPKLRGEVEVKEPQSLEETIRIAVTMEEISSGSQRVAGKTFTHLNPMVKPTHSRCKAASLLTAHQKQYPWKLGRYRKIEKPSRRK